MKSKARNGLESADPGLSKAQGCIHEALDGRTDSTSLKQKERSNYLIELKTP